MNWRGRARRCREPPLALIRLQWWREVVEGARRRHEVAEPLAGAIEAGELGRPELLALIDAREIEAEPTIDTLEAWRAICWEMPAGWRSPPAGCWARPTPRSFVQRAPPMASQAYCATYPHTRGRDVACCLTMCCRSTD